MTIFSSNLKHPYFFDRQQLNADDLNLVQHYHATRIQQLNQHVVGWGVACGAMVNIIYINNNQQSIADRFGKRPTKRPIIGSNTVTISEGFAITPNGETLYIPPIKQLDLTREIYKACDVPEEDCDDAIVSLQDKALQDRKKRAREEHEEKFGRKREITKDQIFNEVLYLIARPAKIPSKPQPNFPEKCGHPGNQFTHSRFCEAVNIELVCDISHIHKNPQKNCESLISLVCQKRKRRASFTRLYNELMACPPTVREQDNYVVLAEIRLSNPNYYQDDDDDQHYGYGYGYGYQRDDYANDYPRNYTKEEAIERRKAQSKIEKQRKKYGNVIFIRNIINEARKLLLSNDLLYQTIQCLCSDSEVSPPIDDPVDDSPEPVDDSPKDEQPKDEQPTDERPKDPDPQTEAIDVDWTIIEQLDDQVYDIFKGKEISVDEMFLLSDEHKRVLHERGIGTLLDLYAADTKDLTKALGLPERDIVRYKDNALESMRRAEEITLDDNQFDLEKGMRTPIEEVQHIGRVRGETLGKAGYYSAVDIANTQPQKLAKVLSVSEETASEMIGDAQLKILR